MQTQKELVLKDHVGSISQVIDIDTQKIVERNASEPFGLARGIPMLTNSVLNEFKVQGNRLEPSLYTNPQSNMRDNWEGKSFEILGINNSNELQGMRGSEIFATGKFSASTGIHSMGVRAYDPARGLWMSPDLYFGQNLELMFSSPDEANLYQYAVNNPISSNDPSGENVLKKVVVKTIHTGDLVSTAHNTANNIVNNGSTIISSNSNIHEKYQATSNLIGEFLPLNAQDIYDVAYCVKTIISTANTLINNIANTNSSNQNATNTVGVRSQIHHICTDKNPSSSKNGGPWTPRFSEMFEKAGLDISKSDANKVSVPGHAGRHPKEYHQEVYKRLKRATDNFEGNKYKEAFLHELNNIKKDILTPGHQLNTYLTTRRSKDSDTNSGSGTASKSSVDKERITSNKQKH
jgi:RHS repeat-associated protein